jgi:hypothetical protein
MTSELDSNTRLLKENAKREVEIAKIDNQMAIDEKNHERNMMRIGWEREERKQRAHMKVEEMRLLFGEDLETRNNYLVEEMKGQMLFANAPKSMRTVYIPHDVKMVSSQPFVAVN